MKAQLLLLMSLPVPEPKSSPFSTCFYVLRSSIVKTYILIISRIFKLEFTANVFVSLGVAFPYKLTLLEE